MKLTILNKTALLLLCLLIGIFCFSQNSRIRSVRNFNQPNLPGGRMPDLECLFIGAPFLLIGKEISWSRENYGKEKYDSLYLRFNPSKFNAQDWIKSAQSAGMKYIVFTAKHMMGFACGIQKQLITIYLIPI